MEVQCPFSSDLFDETMKEVLLNPKQSCVKSGRWEKFAFDCTQSGLTVLLKLCAESVPTRKRKGYELFVDGVEEIGFCREYGDIRLRCILGQESCSVKP